MPARDLNDVRIGIRLQEGLTAIGWRKAQLARAMQISPQAVSNWTLGKTSLQSGDVYRIFRHTGLCSDYLLLGLPGGHLSSEIQKRLPSWLFDDERFNAHVDAFLKKPIAQRPTRDRRASRRLQAL